MNTQFALQFPVCKAVRRDDGTLEFEGIASDEGLDLENEIVKASGYQNPEAEALRGALAEIAGTPRGDVNLRFLGRFLSTYVNRIEGGLVLRQDGVRHGGAPKWKVSEIGRGGVS